MIDSNINDAPLYYLIANKDSPQKRQHSNQSKPENSLFGSDYLPKLHRNDRAARKPLLAVQETRDMLSERADGVMCYYGIKI